MQLGEAQNDYFINEGDQDIDVDDEDTRSLDGLPSDEVLRCPSPPPELPAPTAFAHELSVAEQSAYVKPVLAALMNGQYEPAKWRHVDFMKGGKARQTVTNSAWQRGEVSHKEKNELSDCIRRWMRRRLRRQELGAIPADAALEVGTERPGPPRAPVKVHFRVRRSPPTADASDIRRKSTILNQRGATVHVFRVLTLTLMTALR